MLPSGRSPEDPPHMAWRGGEQLVRVCGQRGGEGANPNGREASLAEAIGAQGDDPHRHLFEVPRRGGVGGIGSTRGPLPAQCAET